MKPTAWVLAGLLLVIGVTSFIFVRVEAGRGAGFVLAQHSAERLTAAGVDRVVRTAPATAHGSPGRRAECTSVGDVGLRNPWHCTISYPGGLRVGYTVQIHLNGAYEGSGQVIYRGGQVTRGTGQISGCCIVVP